MRERKPDVIADLWYKNAVIYNCDVRTYLDANGDGVGDFRGLSRRLDYLAGLGITALWLMPFYASPDRDDGYDVIRLLRGRPALRHARATSSSSRTPRTSAASASSPTWW